MNIYLYDVPFSQVPEQLYSLDTIVCFQCCYDQCVSNAKVMLETDDLMQPGQVLKNLYLFFGFSSNTVHAKNFIG